MSNVNLFQGDDEPGRHYTDLTDDLKDLLRTAISIDSSVHAVAFEACLEQRAGIFPPR
ncbi:MAG: hypothetical protein KDL31_06600 [Kiritimatiellae bacterium]|nr:hypothetical protein [Kiritimatiellia bacterium]